MCARACACALLCAAYRVLVRTMVYFPYFFSTNCVYIYSMCGADNSVFHTNTQRWINGVIAVNLSNQTITKRNLSACRSKVCVLIVARTISILFLCVPFSLVYIWYRLVIFWEGIVLLFFFSFFLFCSGESLTETKAEPKMGNVTIISVFLVIVVIGVISGIDLHRRTPCRYTPTKVKGSKAPTGPICKGQLLLDERFTDFDRDLWKHELTLGGGGVSVTHYQFIWNRDP